jgi:hypothetical protein
MIKLLDQLLDESPKTGKARNANRLGVLALCGLIYWNVQALPDKISAHACHCPGNRSQVSHTSSPSPGGEGWGEGEPSEAIPVQAREADGAPVSDPAQK